MKYERDLLVEEDGLDAVLRAEGAARSLLFAPFVVFPFGEAPEALRNLCNRNEGDEDWLVITREEPEWTPSWLERMASDRDLDVYCLGGAVVYVGSHA